MNVRQTIAILLFAAGCSLIAYGAGDRTASTAAHDAIGAPTLAAAATARFEATVSAAPIQIGTDNAGVTVSIGTRQVFIAWDETEDCTVVPTSARSAACPRR